MPLTISSTGRAKGGLLGVGEGVGALTGRGSCQGWSFSARRGRPGVGTCSLVSLVGYALPGHLLCHFGHII